MIPILIQYFCRKCMYIQFVWVRRFFSGIHTQSYLQLCLELGQYHLVILPTVLKQQGKTISWRG